MCSGCNSKQVKMAPKPVSSGGFSKKVSSGTAKSPWGKPAVKTNFKIGKR